MLSISVNQLFSLLVQYKYVIIFPIVVIEGPVITMLSGFLASLGYLNFFAAYCILVVGDVTGDLMYYAMGRWGRDSFTGRWGRYFGFSPERIARVEAHFKENGERTLIIGKITYGVGTIFLVTAGMVKMSMLKFIRANLIGTLFKSLILMLIGYYFGQAISTISSFLEFIGYLTAAVVLAAAMAVFIYYQRKKIY